MRLLMMIALLGSVVMTPAYGQVAHPNPQVPQGTSVQEVQQVFRAMNNYMATEFQKMNQTLNARLGALQEVLASAIVLVHTAECPRGFERYTEATGHILVGAGAGGQVPAYLQGKNQFMHSTVTSQTRVPGSSYQKLPYMALTPCILKK